MSKSFKLALFLAIVSGLSGLCIAYVNSITEPIIVANNAERERTQLLGMYPDGEFEVLDYTDDIVLKCYKVKDQGFVFKTTAIGYNSSTPIEILIGMNNDGTIEKVSVLKQQETSGYGTRLFEETNIDALYIGNGLNDEIDTLSNATITSKAMKKMMNAAKAAFKEVQ